MEKATISDLAQWTMGRCYGFVSLRDGNGVVNSFKRFVDWERELARNTSCNVSLDSYFSRKGICFPEKCLVL